MTDRRAIVPGLRPLTISAPFGNYIRPEGCTATLGTFTLHDRPGRPWRIAKTLRYYPRLKAWVNKIGLRNPGIGYVQKKVAAGKLDLADKLVSIHGFTPEEWTQLLETIAELKPMGVELNMSCPNVGHIDWPPELFQQAVATGVPVIAKLPPVNYDLMAEQAVDQGVRALHCCNTLPIPAGGLSGLPLKPVALQCIRDLRARPWGHDVLILGGGGITSPQAIDEYRDAGADTFAVGCYVMSPSMLFTHRKLQPLRDRVSE
jgi:dihydroorotate dehydrogenase